MECLRQSQKWHFSEILQYDNIGDYTVPMTNSVNVSDTFLLHNCDSSKSDQRMGQVLYLERIRYLLSYGVVWFLNRAISVDRITAKLPLVAFPISLDTVKSILLVSQLADDEVLCAELGSLLGSRSVVNELLLRKCPCLKLNATLAFLSLTCWN